MFVPFTGGFQLWSQGVLRSAGFPIADLLELGDAGYAAAADRWLDQPGDDTRQALDAAAARATARQSELLSEVARRGDFLEAVTWQNPDVVEPMIVRLGELAGNAPNNQRLRKKQRIAVKYLARYCAKNESIGYFGPVSWFDFRSDMEPLRMKPGPSLVGQGVLHFEPWAIDALAAALSSDPDVRPWIAPRRHPTTHFRETYVRTLMGPIELTGDEARLLSLVDGRHTALAIAAEYGADPSTVYAELDRLAAKGLLLWDLEPPLVHNAEIELRKRLDAIGEPTVRARAIGALDRLEAARDELAGYRDPSDLRRRHEHLEAEFTELTGVDPARRPGQVYGGRRLTYVECTRDVAVSFGPAVLQSFAEPMSLLLTGARWFSHEAAQRVRSVMSEAFDAMGVESVGLTELAFACADKIFTPGNREIDHVMREFADHWRAILGLDTDASVVTHTTEALRGRVEETFAGGYPSWSFARFHSVDLLIAARGPEAFQRGEFQPVLGEVHIGYCPFESPLFSWGHPNPEELRAMLVSEIPDGRVMLSPVKDYPRVSARTYPWLNDARNWWLSVSQYPPRESDRQLPLSGLEVRRDGDRLVSALPGATDQFEFAEIHGNLMMWEMMDAFKHVTRGRDHTPRVVIDDLVVFRESWSFPIAGLDWIVGRGGDPQHFVGARRWRQEHGLPEFVFASISSEPKPIFVDFRSEVQVGNLAQLLRAGAETEGASVTFTEMLPTPDQAWLADAAGKAYSCELRLVFVDGHTSLAD
jgi:hypothetical protein